jgi:hypothetical protein
LSERSCDEASGPYLIRVVDDLEAGADHLHQIEQEQGQGINLTEGDREVVFKKPVKPGIRSDIIRYLQYRVFALHVCERVYL